MSDTLCMVDAGAERRRLTWDWRGVLVLIVVFAAVVRLAYLSHGSLSHSEATRATASWSAPSEIMRWFPPLQYALLWTVRHTLGGSELVLRLPSALAGLGCVLALFVLIRRHVDPWSGICVAAVAASQYELVVHSRRIREFSIETLMCVLTVWAGAEAYRSLSRRSLLAFLGVGVAAVGLTYTGPLLVASWTVVLLWRAVRSGTQWRRRFAGTGVVAAALMLAIVASYFWLSGAPSKGASEYYGVQLRAWPVDYSAATLAGWVVEQSYGMLRYVLGVSRVWPPLDTLLGGFELILMAASLPLLWTRMRSFCLATLLVLGSTMLAGALKLWPYGPYHTMTFLIPLACVSIGCGLRQLAGKLGASPPMAMLIAVCLVLPGARAVKRTVVNPPDGEQLRPVLEYVDAHCGSGDGVFAYYAARWSIGCYWTPDDPESRDIAAFGFGEVRYSRQCNGMGILLQPTSDRGNLARFAERFDDFMEDHPRVWFVFTHDSGDEKETWIGYLRDRYELADQFEVAASVTYLFTPQQGLEPQTQPQPQPRGER